MNTKLTLKLDQHIIEKAKIYASKNKTSISSIVEAYLQYLTSENKREDLEISPFVRSLSSGVKIPVDYDHRKDYTDHLIERYK